MILTISAAAAISVVPYCAWIERGKDKFMGDPIAAVDNYKDIPPSTREKIKAKMRVRAFDDTIHTTRHGSVSQSYRYGQISMMHFGQGNRLCGTVDTSMWSENDPGERALIYSEDGYHVAYFSVCRNVSRITRLSRITPPSPMRVELPPAPVDPLPVTADAPIPHVEPGPLADALPPQSFARLVEPEPDLSRPADEYERISADQPWVEYRSWRLLPPILPPMFAPVFTSITGSPEPVPGITPPTVVPEPMPVQPVPVKPGVPDGSPVPGSVAPIPEPGTWVLMLLGLAGVGAMVRRRT